ncbi:MAG: winged helix-turn-helix transcriptional regulator [Clostridia bacterium]|nr:winged helix-turn-helix transcriptional regulator [Clostridia bacterium]
MNYKAKIIPYFEAQTYLIRRYIKMRTGTRIAQYKKRLELMPKDICACYERIAEIEHELDAAFEDNELLKYYFEPLQTREERPIDDAVTIGGMLLSVIVDPQGDISFESTVTFYKEQPTNVILYNFYDRLSPFFSEPNEECHDISQLIAYIDSILVRPEDKWNLIDAASNPLEHLEKLRPLVCAIVNFIEERTRVLSDFIANEMNEFINNGDLGAKLRSMNLELSNSEFNRITIYPSIMSFNNRYTIFEDDGSIILVLGIFINRLLDDNKTKSDIDTYLPILKVLSDETRLKSLYEMRNKHCFGQELSEIFGGTRNAIYYHLDKLMSVRLINCKSTDYRMLYTMNKKVVYERLTALRDFLVDGWTPDDDGNDNE